MKYIFEKAYFGKAYKTRDGRKALVWYYHVGQNIIDQVVLITTNASQILVDGSGKDLNDPYRDTLNDIVSEWHEEIDKEELDKLAEEHATKYAIPHTSQFINMINGFKAGYRKAKES